MPLRVRSPFAALLLGVRWCNVCSHPARACPNTSLSAEVGLPPLESVECVIADLVAATGALPSLEEDSGIHESLREAASAAGLQATAPATAVSRLHTVDAEVTVEVEEPGESGG